MDSVADFEDEMLAQNLDYDLIFSQYVEAFSRDSPPPFQFRRQNENKMNIITTVNEIIGQKPIGELPTRSDWDEHDSVEEETIALMRKFGLQPSFDQPPIENRTIAITPTTKDALTSVNCRKNMSIFMAESFFKLKPQVEPTFCMDDEPSGSHEESTASTSEITNVTGSSLLSSSNLSQSNIEYKYVSSDNSADSSNTQTDLSWRRTSPPTLESSHSNPREGKGVVKYKSKVWCNKIRNLVPDLNTNWRSGCYEPTEAEKPEETDDQVAGVDKGEPKTTEQRVKDAENVEKCNKDEQKTVTYRIGQCGVRLYKPNERFLNKKAMLIQQVLAENQPNKQ